ncbi:MAG TPA: MATE family efflux transporter [Macellibacteroides fermentans]|uniref:MATE family efflux transporter n=1 Tax=Macellibacteroides fermentans TaxID=879969 RepID=UPI002B733339|nr:MATE family efflux transporter [Macellibacteroides fermentans]
MNITNRLPANYRQHYLHTIKLGIPIMLGQLGIILVGFADNIMVGQHSADELAAASFVNNFFNLAFIFGMGFAYGLTPIIGELFSKGAHDKAAETFKNSLLVNLVVGLLIGLCMLVLLLNIDLLGQPEELMPYIIPYYILQLVSVLFVMLFNSFKQFCDGVTDTMTPMWIMLGSNVLNIIGNYILIYGHFGAPEMGLTGAGLSTLISRIAAILVFVYIFARHPRFAKFRNGFKSGIINKASISRLYHLGFPVALQLGVEAASFSLSVIMMGWLGKTALAAHQVVGVVTTLGFMIYYGIGAAVTIRVSNFRGQDDWKSVRLASFAGLHLILFTALLVVIFLYAVRNVIGYLFTPEAEVAQLTALLMYPVILYQLGDGLQILFANALRGIADVKYMAWMAFICHVCISLPLGYFCGFVLGFGALGVWSGFPISLSLLGILLWIHFNKRTKGRAERPVPARL